MSGRPQEKRKQIGETRETPRKRQLNDAFKSLSLQSERLRRQAGVEEESSRTDTHENDTARESEDVNMRDRSSFAKDKHTIVVNSLEDDSDAELEVEEPRFLFNLPAGSIDTTFAGSAGIPESLLKKSYRPEDSQLVLYRGSAAEVVGRTLTSTAKTSSRNENESSRAAAADPEAMDLD